MDINLHVYHLYTNINYIHNNRILFSYFHITLYRIFYKQEYFINVSYISFRVPSAYNASNLDFRFNNKESFTRFWIRLSTKNSQIAAARDTWRSFSAKEKLAEARAKFTWSYNVKGFPSSFEYV